MSSPPRCSDKSPTKDFHSFLMFLKDSYYFSRLKLDLIQEEDSFLWAAFKIMSQVHK